MESVFHDLAKELAKRDIWCVSTIDHPYASPPERVISSHYRLMNLSEQGHIVVPLIWDSISVPEHGLRRSAATLDVGLIANNDRDLSFFDAGVFYPSARVRKLDFTKLSECFRSVTEHLTEVPEHIRTMNQSALLENFDTLVGIYRREAEGEPQSHQFYLAVLKDLYGLFGITEVGHFIYNNAESAYYSEWLRSFVASCIRETIGTDIGLSPLQNTGDIFHRRLFRGIGTDIQHNITGLQEMASSVERGELLYSAEVFFWSLALAGIRHYGNDYGFFERLSKIPEFAGAEHLQLTEQNTDSYKLFSFRQPRSFHCTWIDGKCIVKHANRIKATRVDTLPAVYLHLGSSATGLTHGLLNDSAHRPMSLEFGTAYTN